MRGTDKVSGSPFGYVDIEDRIPARHPLRRATRIVDEALAGLDAEFARLHATEGRPSIPPEQLTRAGPTQNLPSVGAERLSMGRMQKESASRPAGLSRPELPSEKQRSPPRDLRLSGRFPLQLPVRRFVGLGVDDPVPVPTAFTENRDRLPTADMSREILAALLAHREAAPLRSDARFSVDGMPIKAWASMKSLRPEPTVAPPCDSAPDGPPATARDAGAEQPAPRNPQTTERADPEPAAETAPPPKPVRRDGDAGVDFRGERRSSATLFSTADPDARLSREFRGTGAVLRLMGRALMANRNGQIVSADLTDADRHAERRAALDMIHRHAPGSSRRLTPGVDEGEVSADFVAELREACLTAHVARKARRSAIDSRTTPHTGCALSQRRPGKIAETFGGARAAGGMAQTVLRGLDRVRAG